MFRKKASAVARHSVVKTMNKTGSTDETLSQILHMFRERTVPFSDVDDTFEDRAAAAVESRPPAVLTCKAFAASLVCPKKFHLLQNRPDLVPHISICDAVHLDDGVAFNELARRWDRLQFGSRAVVVHERDFDQAVRRTESVLVKYFQTVHAQLGEQAPTLTIHRPAFSAPFGGDKSFDVIKTHPYLLRARPAVLRFRPKDNQWVILETAAILDPFSSAASLAKCLQRFHFTTLAFRYWVTQPHIPIQVRKRFLNIDLDTVTEENLKGHRLESTAQVAVPLDLKRSGFLHIRQFFPGPVTLLDCDPSRLVKYVQRLSLEDLLEAHMCSSNRSAGAFDLSGVCGTGNALVNELQTKIGAFQKRGQEYRHLGRSTSGRTSKKKDSELRELFTLQQKLMEALILTHTLPLLVKSRDPINAQKWVNFANLDDGKLRPTFDDDEEIVVPGDKENATRKKSTSRKKKEEEKEKASDTTSSQKCVSIPVYSEFIGSHCSRGETCPFFTEGMCLPNKFESPLRRRDNHLFAVPSTAVSRKTLWWSQGLRTVRDVLYHYKKGTLKLTAPQLRNVKAVAEGKLCVNPKEIEDFFSKIRYPAFFIDFEATQFALPPFEKVVAYQSTPFQFSLDVFQEDILNETPTHYDFLHFGKGYSPNVDPRHGCVEELMRIVRLERERKRQSMVASGELDRIERQTRLQEEEEAKVTKRRGRQSTKPKIIHITKSSPLQEPVNPYDGCFIAHFASFEKSCLEKLGQLMDEHKDDIKQFYFLDTLDLFKRGFVHPNAHGSNSLKKVLPALCPDFQYGVFGEEGCDDYGDTSASDADGGNGGRQDEQKGENAMGVYRLWYHHEGGGSLKDLQQIASRDYQRKQSGGSVGEQQAEQLPHLTALPLARQDVRDRAWAMLRIQLLEYCSLDTKALYEIMRQVWREKEVAKGMKSDKGGWIMVEPLPREVNF